MSEYPELRTHDFSGITIPVQAVVGAADALVWLHSDHKIVITLSMDQARLFCGTFSSPFYW